MEGRWVRVDTANRFDLRMQSQLMKAAEESLETEIRHALKAGDEKPAAVDREAAMLRLL